jgi:hypothetical protein
MEFKRGNLIWGIFLILIGLVLLIGNLSQVGMEILWPVFPLTVGLSFWIGYVHDRKNHGLLMPGSILVVVSLLFFYCNLFGWWHMETLWPIFIMAPAVGFIAMYFGGKKERGLLIPAGILFSLGIIFLFVSSGLGDYWPVFLIIAGLLLIVSQRFNQKKNHQQTEN